MAFFFKFIIIILNILGSKTCQDNLSSFAKGIPEGHTSGFPGFCLHLCTGPDKPKKEGSTSPVATGS